MINYAYVTVKNPKNRPGDVVPLTASVTFIGVLQLVRLLHWY
jgi:hypothetical protein